MTGKEKLSKSRARLNKKLAAYSAMAAGVVGAAQTSEAVVTQFNDINLVVPVTSNFFDNLTWVDIDGMATTLGGSYNNPPAGFEVAVLNYGLANFQNPFLIVANGSAMDALATAGASTIWMPRLSTSQSIGPSRGFSFLGDDLFTATSGGSLFNNATQPWSPGDTGFVGFRIDLTGGDFQYGWVQLQVDAAVGGNVTILAAAIESEANTPIHAVPEPATFGLAMLALGALGVSALKRRRACEAEAA